MNRAILRRAWALLLLSGCWLSAVAAPPGRYNGPWNLEELRQPPQATWEPSDGGVQTVFYEGQPYQDKPTRVYALYGRPCAGDGPFPAMLLVHGGGGTAFADWVAVWTQRGYAALAMDLRGQGPGEQKSPDGAPDFDQLFLEFDKDEADKLWSYHAIAAIQGAF